MITLEDVLVGMEPYLCWNFQVSLLIFLLFFILFLHCFPDLKAESCLLVNSVRVFFSPSTC